MFGLFNKKAQAQPEQQALRHPPVPEWRPDIVQPVDQLLERLRYYTSQQRDIAVFSHGTFVFLPEGLSEEAAHAFAIDALSKVFNAHPDMDPLPMKDGNILVQYNHGVVNLVLDSVATEHLPVIDENHTGHSPRTRFSSRPWARMSLMTLGRR